MIGTWGVGNVRCKVHNALRKGYALGYLKPNIPDAKMYVVVLWDGTKRPACVDASVLLFKHNGDRRFYKETFPE